MDSLSIRLAKPLKSPPWVMVSFGVVPPYSAPVIPAKVGMTAAWRAHLSQMTLLPRVDESLHERQTSRRLLLARPHPIAPLVFGAEERIIRGAQQVFKSSAIFREGGDAKR